MALDGIAVSNIVYELKQKLLGGRIDKIYQPQKDEILFSVRSIGSTFRVLLSANPSHPRAHLTEIAKENPMTAPMFCMVLRKYIAGGKIVDILQPGFERIIEIHIDSLNELGDRATKRLILEIMGKHSNLILVDEKGKILDAIKHISHEKSSVREVLPAKEYLTPPTQQKQNPLLANWEDFWELAQNRLGMKAQNFLYQSYTGISPISASEICTRANIDPSNALEIFSEGEIHTLFQKFSAFFQAVKNEQFSPAIIYDSTGKIIDFSAMEMTQFAAYTKKKFDSISVLLESFYAQKDNAYHIQQRAHDMRRLILSNIERCVKKREIQEKTRNEIANRETWKLKGELITANIYQVEKGMTSLQAPNYYEPDAPMMEIALDPTKTPSENAQWYYNKYNKAKRTLAALEVQSKQNEEELAYLEGVLIAIEAATETADLTEIKNELIHEGFIKRKGVSKAKDTRLKKSKPLHYLSSDGLDIYVGKSNTQNDELTLRFAQSTDIWLHTKNIPGSHVIIKTNGTAQAPEQTLIEAANLAAYYSKAKASSSVPVDYTLKKFVKKPNGAKPGMVIYEQNRTLYITPNEAMIRQMKQE